MIQRGCVEQPHLGADLADLQATLLKLHGIRVLENDLVAALAVNFVGDDVEIEKFDLLIGEFVFFTERRRLLAVDRRYL